MLITSCIHVLSWLLINGGAQVGVPMMTSQPSLQGENTAYRSASMMCPDAGPDDEVCGFEYVLQGSDSLGSWRTLCSRNPAGEVWIVSPGSDTTDVKVSECGEYTFVYDVSGGPCAGSDTVKVFFEDPSWMVTIATLDIELSLVVNCIGDGGTVSCENEITVQGEEPPYLEWEFCAGLTCESMEYFVNSTSGPDSCLALDIICDSTRVTDGDSGCSTFKDITGTELEDILEDIFADLDIACTPPEPCYEIPPECIDVVIDTLDVIIPLLDGGQWHYIPSGGGAVPLNDTSLFSIAGVDYVLIIEPGADYYGPGEIDFTLWQVANDGTWIQLTTQVDIDVQWLPVYVRDTVNIIDTFFIVVDSCDVLPCGGITNIPAVIDIPVDPAWPCGPLGLSFNVGNDDQFWIILIDCFSSGEQIEVCPGQIEFFDIPGIYDYVCQIAPGCFSSTIVEVYEEFALPVVSTVSTSCSPVDLTFDATLNITGGNGQFQIDGFGVFNYGDDVTLTGFPACDPFTVFITDLNSGCQISYTLFDCCGCQPSSSNISAAICVDDMYDFNGQLLNTTGLYSDTTANAQGCDSITTLTLTVYQMSTSDTTMKLCDGEGIWFNGQMLFDQGTYQSVSPDVRGCDSMHLLYLEVVPLSSTSIEIVLCSGETIDFNGTPIIEGGVYRDTLVTIAGCDSIIEFVVNEKEIVFDLTAQNSCLTFADGVIAITNVQNGEPPFAYRLDGLLTDSAAITGLAPGSYTVSVQDADGCEATMDISISQTPMLQINLEDTYRICRSEVIELNSSELAIDGNIILWDDGTMDPIRKISSSGAYWLEIQNECETIRKDFNVDIDESEPADRLFVPNVFTPNGDGINDEFKVFSDALVTDLELHIYDRWGDELIRFDNLDDVWDGTFLNKVMNPGVYVWWLRATVEGCDGSEQRVRKKGDVTIVR